MYPKIAHLLLEFSASSPLTEIAEYMRRVCIYMTCLSLVGFADNSCCYSLNFSVEIMRLSH